MNQVVRARTHRISSVALATREGYRCEYATMRCGLIVPYEPMDLHKDEERWLWTQPACVRCYRQPA